MKQPWLRTWAFVTLTCVFGMLALGALVTSFKAGMADNTWPRTPWHLFVIEWQSWGLVIEHTHRFIGYVLGIMILGLTIGHWLYERNGGLRVLGIGSLACILFSAGLGMWLMRTLQPTGPALGLAEPPMERDHEVLFWVTVIQALWGFAALLVALICVAWARQPGGWARILASLTLVGVLGQGLLGGFRVKLNALYGADFAAIHGAFSQIVLALAVLTALATGAIDTPESRRMHAESTTRLERWALCAAILVFLQVLAGVVLRHSDSAIGWLGPRLHLWLVFPAVIAVCGTAWRILHTAAPTGVRALAWLAFGLVATQIGLGIESWLHRFAHGFAEAPLQQVTVADALLRTSHSVIGYGLFATAIALAYQTRRPVEAVRSASVRSREGVV